jgi:mono/diheme cytochrome c family protein
LALAFFLALAASVRAQDAKTPSPTFEHDILPVLTKQCLGCHGGLRQKGGLDMRTVPLMLKGGKNGPAVKTGDVNGSPLWQRIASDEMPPGETKLSITEKAAIKQWIASGMPTVSQQPRDDESLLKVGVKHEPREVAAAIDKHIGQRLAALKSGAADRSDDVEFLRRVTLDLSGCVPTAQEAAAFLDNKAPDKRAQLIDKLLASPRFGEQLGRTWREWICPPELPSDMNGGAQPHKQAQAFGDWIGKQITKGATWDKIVRDILTVDGQIKDNPHVIFYGLVGEGSKATPDGAARAAGSFFLGVQLQCAQCHDDPYRNWAQNEYWALAAFFGRTQGDFNVVTEGKPPANLSKRGPKMLVAKGTEIVIPPSAFKNAGKTVRAGFLGGKTINFDDEKPLRPVLADWVTAKDNPYFAKAFANRMWFYFFARGIVNPVDDLRDLNPPSHPGLLNLLGNEFTASGFDIKHLVRCICNSEAYQRTSRASVKEDRQAIALQTAAFGRMPLRVMTADILYDSLRQLYGDPKLDLRADDAKGAAAMGQAAQIADPYIEFLRRFGTNKDDAADFTHGIPQMLTMINHPRLLSGSKALDAFRKTNPTPEQTVEWLYLSALSRRPTDSERKAATQYLANSQNSYVGVLWMLVNRSEFLFIR